MRQHTLIKPLLILLYVVSPLLVLLIYFRYNWYSFFHDWSLATFFGICAFCYFANQFITGSRLRWLDRLYGYDRILVFHRVMGGVGLLCALVHARLRHHLAYDAQNIIGRVSLVLFIVLIIFAVLLLSHKPPRFRWHAALKRLQKRLGIGYQHLVRIHNITAIAMLLALLHVMLAGSSRESIFRSGVVVVWYIVAMLSYVNHKVITPRKLVRQPFVVQEVRALCSTVTTVVLKKPEGWRRSIAPGTFGFIKVLGSDTISDTRQAESRQEIQRQSDEHPFTFSAVDQQTVSVTIKANGDWTDAVATFVKPNDLVRVQAPFGSFSHSKLPASSHKSLVMIAAGIGITPFMAMLADLAQHGDRRQIALLWKVKPHESHIIDRELMEWQRALPNLTVHTVVSGSLPTGSVEELLDIISPEALSSSEIFFCSPPLMNTALYKSLRARKIARRHIHFENFGF